MESLKNKAVYNQSVAPLFARPHTHRDKKEHGPVHPTTRVPRAQIVRQNDPSLPRVFISGRLPLHERQGSEGADG